MRQSDVAGSKKGRTLLQLKQGRNPRCLLSLFGVVLCMFAAVAVYGVERVQVKVIVKVSDVDGKPIPDAIVEVDRKGEKNEKGGALDQIKGSTNADGLYVTPGRAKFFELSGKPHRVTVTIPGVDELLQQEISDDNLRAAATKGELVVTFGVKSPDAVKIKLNGRVTSANGQPIPKAEVSLLKSDGSTVTKITTGDDGKYELYSQSPLSDETLQVFIAATNFETQVKAIHFRDLRRGEENPLAIDVSLAPQKTDSTIDALLTILRYSWIPALFLIAAVLGFVARPFLEKLKGTFEARDQLTASEQYFKGLSSAVESVKQSTLTKSDLRIELTTFVDLVASAVKNAQPVVPANDGSSGRHDTNQRSNDGNAPSYRPTYDSQEYELPKSGVEGAQSSYRRLLNKTLESTPVYLDVEGARSAGGKLEDGAVYLTQVSTTQSPLVLFSDDDGNAGWVFPNPKVAFRQAALKDVFPNLSEADYEGAKETLQPMTVRRLHDGRWRVERG
jgi:hypothetical protein